MRQLERRRAARRWRLWRGRGAALVVYLLPVALTGWLAPRTVLSLVLLVLVVILIFNTYMRFRAIREAARIAKDTRFRGSFQNADYEGDGDAGVLFLHGLLGTPHDFSLIMRRLRRRRISYHAPMLGGSPPSPTAGTGCTPALLARHAELAFRHLARRCRRIVVVGFSTGGVQAVALAGRHRLEGLVVVAPAFALARRWYLLPSTQFWVRLLAPLLPLVPAARRTARHPGQRRHHPRLGILALQAVAALMDYGKQVLARSRHVHAPVLCILPRSDALVDPRAGEAGVKLLASRWKRIARFDRSNHSILADCDRHRVVEDIVAFITQRIAPNRRPFHPPAAPASRGTAVPWEPDRAEQAAVPSSLN